MGNDMDGEAGVKRLSPQLFTIILHKQRRLMIQLPSGQQREWILVKVSYWLSVVSSHW